MGCSSWWLKTKSQAVPSLLRRMIVVLPTLLLLGCAGASAQRTICGKVVGDRNPLSDAVVRLQATENQTTTDEGGRFTLTVPRSDDAVFVTAWSPGHYIAGEEVDPGQDEIEIHLHAHAGEDHADYEWLPSEHHPGQGEDHGCAECHSSEGTDLAYTLPFDEWLQDAHAQAASNPRFLSMYAGTDLAGNRSPDTRYAVSRDYGSFPLPPDPNEPYFGPGYKLDFPEAAGNCGACHTPAAAVNDPYGIDPTTLSGRTADGMPCDFCHKIWDVRLDPDTGLPFPNVPGVLSFEFRRPPEGHQFFAGPLDDVAPGEDTFSPVQTQSEYCAPCHFGVFWDTVIYNAFGEWLVSPYSDPETGQTCQDCHMPPLGNPRFAQPEVGGLERDPDTIFSHRMPGALDEALLQSAVSLAVEAKIEGREVIVSATITNDQTGHHVPTDSPLRQVILLVEVTDAQGHRLAQLEGPTVPQWGGVGDPDEGYYAGMPGSAYAKILEEVWTGVSPSGAYWNPTRVLSDNRIPAMERVTSRYVFQLPEAATTSGVSVDVRLLFHRAFIELMDQKGWQVPDMLMERETMVLGVLKDGPGKQPLDGATASEREL